jgi:hypothetical protein
MAEVINTTVGDSEISSELDLVSNLSISASAKRKIKEEVGEYLKEQILLSVGESKSPIVGEKFPALSKSYKKFKEDNNRPGTANLEFNGDMLDALDYELTEDGVKIGIYGSEAPKADGHNNFSGDSEIPQRRFLPEKGQKFKADIDREINRIIADAVVDGVDLPRARISEIETKSELIELLDEMFPDFTFAEIREAILRNEELLELLDDNNLLQFINVSNR